MELEHFVYPPYGTPLIEAYDRRFESVFVVLHPFICMPESHAWSATKHYPTDEEILAVGSKCRWAEVAAQTGMNSCARMNQALLTSIGSLADYLCDYPARDALQNYLKSGPVWMPGEGRFEPLLHADLLSAFESAGAYDHLIFVPEFPQTDPPETVFIAALKERSLPFPTRGSLLPPDASILFTVDWDSFFTLLYGPRSLVEHIVKSRNLEGFFATPLTEHAWFNYSLGCATVTVSPEDWPSLG